MCYPSCPQNYSGVGPVCWQDCPGATTLRDGGPRRTVLSTPAFANNGAFCHKPHVGYWRGWGHFSKGYCESHTSAASAGGECERCFGFLFFPKCRNGFHAWGCNWCSLDCPEGMADIGSSCEKRFHGRGVGRPLTCTRNQEQSGALCYEPCASTEEDRVSELKTVGIGPVCWENLCPAGGVFARSGDEEDLQQER